MVNGWIDTSGTFHRCGLMGHHELATDLIKKNKNTDHAFDRDKDNDLLEYMYRIGYREVRQFHDGGTVWFLPETKRWNTQQVKTAVTICIELEIETPEVLYGV